MRSKPRLKKKLKKVWHSGLGEWVLRDEDTREIVSYWLCRSNSIFCGGYLRVKRRLCTNCLTKLYHQNGGKLHSQVWSIWRHRDGEYRVHLNCLLFQNRRKVKFSLARMIYERCTNTILPDNIVVRNLVPHKPLAFENLILTRNGVRDVTKQLSEIDIAREGIVDGGRTIHLGI